MAEEKTEAPSLEREKEPVVEEKTEAPSLEGEKEPVMEEKTEAPSSEGEKEPVMEEKTEESSGDPVPDPEQDSADGEEKNVSCLVSSSPSQFLCSRALFQEFHELYTQLMHALNEFITPTISFQLTNMQKYMDTCDAFSLSFFLPSSFNSSNHNSLKENLTKFVELSKHLPNTPNGSERQLSVFWKSAMSLAYSIRHSTPGGVFFSRVRLDSSINANNNTLIQFHSLY